MDLGSEICKPRNPLCESCPLNKDCLAFNLGEISNFPVKTKKVKATDLELHYSFVEFDGQFLIKQRKDDFIWKKLYEFPIEIPVEWDEFKVKEKTITHKLTHKNLTIQMSHIVLESKEIFTEFAAENGFSIINEEESHQKSFPKPLENYLTELNLS
jgi:A/G-specific adenine glycosylase